MSDTRKKVALLANITPDLIAGKLRGKYDFYLPQGFDTWVQEVLDPGSGLWQARVDAAVLLLDGTEARSWKSPAEGTEKLSLWKQALGALADRMENVPVFVSTLDIRENRIRTLAERSFRLAWENDWYQYAQGLVERKNSLFLFDLADAAAEMGRSRFYSNKMWYLSSMPYSREGLAAVCREIDRALEAAFAPRRKLIALDLDNTLWGGVVGEDGPEGLTLSDHKEGQRFYDFQRQLKEMKNRGTLLAIASKNNPEDAEAVIRNHPAMLLREEDFAASRINWREKAANLKEMAAELNLTEGGFLFVDDNPLEREKVRGECPEMLTPDFPEDTAELLPFAENLWWDYLRPLRALAEDRQKTEMYRAEALRRQEQAESLSPEDYIRKLEMRVDIHPLRPEEMERTAQLIGKTNQFNLTTRRYTLAQVRQMAEDGQHILYTVSSGDRYGDNGLIAVVILEDRGQDLMVDTFLMSCRVMGRKLEDAIIHELSAYYPGRRLLGEYIPTAKNAPVRDLYDRLGFEKLSEQEEGRKLYALSGGGPAEPDYYREIRFQGAKG